MDVHHGQIIERVIRREGYSISEIARLTNVNRRSVYNWFNQQFLKSEIIYKIGISINHDFSVEFPHLFNSDDFKRQTPVNHTAQQYATQADQSTNQQNNESYWKDKYIALLEKYNDILIKNVERNSVKISVEGTINQ
ncbi:helix-turn-helix domain containing protein [Mucilaginibacter sp. UR6-1]|uniref:helix-turn-helix domain-containing protein n=1 Tax=Mucilaginibacter sp. UR6-1 TaxID=1435643 RepID=UPI001E349678|nr:helix-turn-helix domain-containing protein [Mucilaginibacter sp. UR6-1]MCC8408173.1 helix-turn-helix domain containing protein [Mucilaginibacter sp. UR6-1]